MEKFNLAFFIVHFNILVVLRLKTKLRLSLKIFVNYFLRNSELLHAWELSSHFTNQSLLVFLCYLINEKELSIVCELCFSILAQLHSIKNNGDWRSLIMEISQLSTLLLL